MGQLSPGLLTTEYVFDERHAILSDAKASVYGPNIGSDGRNLTISFLQLNRAALSIRLLDSIQQHLVNFAGEVLIGDNGSHPAELEKLKTYLVTFPYRYRVLEFGENFGVAGGRNRIFAQARTDWVISLDNDIFLIANHLAEIQEQLGLLGCHFMSFPLINPDRQTLFSFGACLQTTLQEGRPRLTINPVVAPGTPLLGSDARDDNIPRAAFLSTFLYGGASILHRTSFERLGGFDDKMLLGFEDIDFSLRLFREGMKVGTSSSLFLVHDHPKAELEADLEYERTRYSRKTLFDSAQYLEAKTGFKIWGAEVESWMQSSEKKQGFPSVVIPLAPNSSAKGNSVLSSRPRPRVALITDTDNWAFANISHQLKRHISSNFEFEVFPLVTFCEIERNRWYRGNCQGYFADGGASALGMALVAAEDYDIIHVFWREFLTVIDSPLLEAYAKRFGMSYEQFRARFIEKKIVSTCVYDHLFLSQEDMQSRRHIFSDLTRGYYVSSRRLATIYGAIPGIPPPKAVLPDGVDLTLFRPRNLERFQNINHRQINVGWVGHSGWAGSIEDFKGVDTILIPAIDELRSEGAPVERLFADRKAGFIPHDQMPEYYAKIDVLVCTSKIEGTPNPVLEAMACGVPVITTDVGIVPDVVGELQSSYVLKERSIPALKEALRRLILTPNHFAELSSENLEVIQSQDWSLKAKGFVDYFANLITERQAETGDIRTKICMLPFQSPSMEPSGSIRLCSASSIFDHYEDTDMGNCQRDGLAAVWKGQRYREVRQSLLLGKELKPYCAKCQYRFDGQAWMLQLHLSLHAWHNGNRSPDVVKLIVRHRQRYASYKEDARNVGLNVYDIPAELERQIELTAGAEESSSLLANRRVDWDRLQHELAPEPLIEGSAMPIYMDFNTLNRCNVTCIMCPPAIRYDKLGQKRDPYYRLTLAEYKKITDGVKISSAHFVGAYAEPLLNKEIFDLVGYAKSLGAFTAITSNGLALSRPFAAKLLDAGLDMITISLHGATKSVAETVMLKSDFNRIVSNIGGLQDLKRERRTQTPTVYFNYVAQRANVGDIPAFIDLAHSLGVHNVNLIHLIDGDPAVDRATNLEHLPDVLCKNLEEAVAKATSHGINLSISPALLEIQKRHHESLQHPVNRTQTNAA